MVFLEAANRPILIVHVQQRIDVNQIHARFVVGIDRSDISPVGLTLVILVAERIREDAAVVDDGRNNIFAKIVAAGGIVGVFEQLLK